MRWLLPLVWLVVSVKASFWLGDINAKQGAVPSNPSYQVFRNVQTDYGAKGDGTTDDTAAIQKAISDGNRCGFQCGSSTTLPALVYFPAGKYLISSSLQLNYFTALVGDYNAKPTVIASSSFTGNYVVDANPYLSNGTNWYPSVNNFFQRINNFVIDVRGGPATLSGIHWQVSQATSLTNVEFWMVPGSTQAGIFIENGSLGILSDLYFNGGIGLIIGNQQYTLRGLTFQNCAPGIRQLWDWGATMSNLTFYDCAVGIDSITGTTSKTNQLVNALVLTDVKATNTPILLNITKNQGNYVVQNLDTTNVSHVILQGSQTLLQGSSGSISVPGWAQGSFYSGISSSSEIKQGPDTGPSRPLGLTTNNNYFYGKSRPQYQTYGASSFVSVKDHGCKGDGSTDDTQAFQAVLNSYSSSNIIYVPHGQYIVTDTVHIPVGTRMVGEVFSMLLGAGSNFNDGTNPRVVFQIGKAGDTGVVEITDIIFSTRGPSAGAIVVEWNVKESIQGSASMHGTHVILGGFAGSNLQNTQCTANETFTDDCRAAYLAFHLTKTASAYLEETWIWTADHDLETFNAAQLNLFSGRGMLMESQGPTWLYGTASEHHVLYQYNFAAAQNVYAGQLQTETPYFSGSGFPVASTISPPNSAYSDPTFSNCGNNNAYCDRAWGLYSKGSSNLLLYGAGVYSFFSDDYQQECIDGLACQQSIVAFQGTNSSVLYNLNTIGANSMIDNGPGATIVSAQSNRNGGGIAQGIAAYTLLS